MPDNIINLADRIKEISYTMGTGNLALSGPVVGFSSFSSFYSNNDNLFYAVTDGTDYEVGSGIFLNDSYDELARFPISSSNGNDLVDFPEGTKEVYVTYPASHSVYIGSGVSNINSPDSSGIAFWNSRNMLDYDSALCWDKEFKRLGINNAAPDYGIHLGGNGAESIVKASGFMVSLSGIYFPPMNDGDNEYEGGTQLSHYEKNRLDQYAFDNSLIGELTGSDTVLQLSGIANQFILFKKQDAGTVLAGPPSGCTAPCSPDYPYFRQLTLDDIPGILTISGVNNSTLTSISGVLNNKITSVSGVLRNDLTIVSGIASANTSNTYNSIANGRLTLESNVPVSNSDQSSKSIVYYTAFNGNTIALYNTTSSSWENVTFSQVSLALSSLTSGKNYDIFGYNNAGSLTLELGPAWTSDTSRSTNIILQNGVYCKSGTLSRRYLGTIRTTSSSTTEDSLTKRFVWNANNRINRKVYYPSAIGPWTYNTDSWRELNSTLYLLEIVNGLTFDIIDISAGVLVATPQANVTNTYYFGIAKDGGTSTGIMGVRSQTYGNATQTQLSARVIDNVGIGYHSYYPVERVFGGNTITLYGGNQGSYFGGIHGTWEC